MLELKALQTKIREKVIRRYKDGNLPPEIGFSNAQVAFKALTMGDKMYETCLVDRNFYRRTPMYNTQNKKEGKIIERFETQMRNNQRNRKLDSHKEFLNKVIEHAKNFIEFHKKKQKKIKK